MANFKDIINDIDTFHVEHTQVNYFDWGNIYEINTNDFTFTSIFVNPKPSSTLDNITTFKLDVYILDLMEQDESNLLDIMNNTTIIGNDLINYFIENDFEYEIDEYNIVITPFVGKWDHLLAGWVYTIDFNISLSSGCEIPTK
jgi:hypothetical protein